MVTCTMPGFTNYTDVKKVGSKSEYIGYSTNTKPSTLRVDQAGSTFYELNTGKKWI